MTSQTLTLFGRTYQLSEPDTLTGEASCLCDSQLGPETIRLDVTSADGWHQVDLTIVINGADAVVSHGKQCSSPQDSLEMALSSLGDVRELLSKSPPERRPQRRFAAPEVHRRAKSLTSSIGAALRAKM